MKIKQLMGTIGRFIADSVFPLNFTCDICGIETFDGNLCPECLKTISFNNKETCPVCGRKTSKPEICLECKAKAPLFKKAVSPLVYENGTTVLISRFKNGSSYLKEHFSELIAKKLVDFPAFDCIVFVPMTETAIQKRGYNQAEILANSLSDRIKLPVIKDALIKQKDTAEQKLLSQKEREKNLKSCFKIENRKDIHGKNILLVDDIMTTGATSEALCKLLLNAGAKNVYFATVASVEYKQKKD